MELVTVKVPQFNKFCKICQHSEIDNSVGAFFQK